MNRLFDGIVYFLPVFLPFLLAIFSVITRIVAGSMKPSARTFLKTYTDIALGIFSFDVWALVTFIQTKQIALNVDLEILPSKVLVLIIWNVMWLFVAAIVSKIDWAGPAETPSWKHPRTERLMDGFMMAITVFLFILPIFLTTPVKAPEKRVAGTRFHVVVPYEDPSVAQHIGPSRWAGRLLCETALVEAPSEEDATRRVKAQFAKTRSGRVLFPRRSEVRETRIVESSFWPGRWTRGAQLSPFLHTSGIR